MDDEELLMKALKKAKEKFNETISKEGLDPAYFALDLQGYQLSANFNKFRHSIEMYDQEAGEIQNEKNREEL